MAQIETLASLSGGFEPNSAVQLDPQSGAGAIMAPAIDGELGAAGTPIFGGFLRELGEYNPNFSGGPFACFMLYEQMRRSDAQVAMVLNAMKLPIRGAEWMIVAPDDASDMEKEAAEFVEHNLFERIKFKSALENALLMLDFGVAAHEDVWTIDDGPSGKMVCLKDLAPRLPLTFYRWLTKEGTDELVGLNQMGYRAGSYVQTTIPVGKLGLFTFRQEGKNFAGRSLLREIYQHWYTKQALYAIDAITCERNGMGVPVITMGGKSSKEDRLAATQWVQSLITHEKTGIVLPPEWTFKLEGVTGTVHDCKDSIQHHNMMIAMAGLLAFMVMGQGQHSSGNRSLGETMSDFFFMGEQATADLVGEVFTQTTIKRLVDFNFPGVVNYPRLVPQRIMALKFDGIVDALNKLGLAQIITPDLELESWVRKQMGAPEQAADAQTGDDPETGNRARPVDRPGELESETPAAPQSGGGSSGKQSGKRAGKSKVRATDADGMNIPAGLKRAPRGAEVHLALTEIVRGLDKGRDDIAGSLRAARGRIQTEVVHKLASTPVRKMHQVSIAPDAKLLAAVHDHIVGLHDFGVRQVAGERQRQLAGGKVPDAQTVRMTAKRDPLGLYADGVVSEFQNSLTARAASAAINRTRQQGDATTKGEVIQQIQQDLDDQSDKWIDGVASKGANEGFADGRDAGYEQYKDEIGSVIYSALLDINTCGNCADADGAEGATPDDIPDAPNPDCDGGDKCRCVHVYVFSDEGSKVA